MRKSKDKNKDEVPNPTSVANRDILQRLNFLYQASVLLSGLAPPSSSPEDDNGEDQPQPSLTPSDKDTLAGDDDPLPQPDTLQVKGKKRQRVVSFGELSRSYVETMKNVGQKTNVRIDPSVKRRICKRCSAPLIPGISATVRIKDSPSHGHLISYQCHECQTERRIPAPPMLHADPPLNESAMQGVQAGEAATPCAPAAIAGDGNSPRLGRWRRKKRGPQPRLPPYFAREVGHVVFRGNERLDTAQGVS